MPKCYPNRVAAVVGVDRLDHLDMAHIALGGYERTFSLEEMFDLFEMRDRLHTRRPCGVLNQEAT